MKKQREILLADGTRVPHALLDPVVRTMKMLSAKWKLEILFALSEGHSRFGELHRAIPGITQHMLATRLRELEQEGLITRFDFEEVPPRVEYALTESASSLRPICESLLAWTNHYTREGIRRP